MTVGNASDFKVYDEQFFGGMTEILQQNSQLFNKASAGALVYNIRGIKGDFERESFFKSMGATIVSRRDTTSNAAVVSQKLTQGEFVGVKLNRRIGPLSDTVDAFKKINEDPELFSFAIGQQAAEVVAEDYLNMALYALVASIQNINALNVDKSAQLQPLIESSYLVDGLQTFGDKNGRIVCWLSHSKNFNDLIKNAIGQKIFEEAGVVVYGGTPGTFNRPWVVTDSPALINGDGTYNVLGLTSGAVEIAESEGRTIVSDLKTEEEQLRMIIQGEHAFNIRIKGCAWDTTAGNNPTQATLATAANWINRMASVKSNAGFIIKVQ